MSRPAEQEPPGSEHPGGMRLTAHPRARRHIRLARGWAALAGFVLAGLAADGGGLSTFDVASRALAGGVAGALVGWAVSIAVWRQLALAELRARVRPPAPQGAEPLHASRLDQQGGEP
jgi:hypothetical protein